MISVICISANIHIIYELFLEELFGVSVSEAPQNYQFGETTFRAYSIPLRTLNGKLTPFSHLKVSNGARTSAVLNGILRGIPLYGPALTLPKLIVLLLQIASFRY